MGLSFVALLLVREPVGGPVAPRVALRAHLARVPELLRRDRNLSWFLAARATAIVGQMAVGFYTVYALRAWAAPAAQAGGVHRAAGRRTTSPARWRSPGWRTTPAIGSSSSAGWPRPSAPTCWRWPVPRCRLDGLVFVLAGVQQAAFSVSNMPVLLEFAPSDDERPIYVGLGTTSLAPVAFAAPLIAGLLADALGFRAVFVGGLRRLAGRPDDAGRARSRSPARWCVRGGVARVKAVLLDLDDTLLDYSGGAEQCWAQACAAGAQRARPDGAARRARPRSAAGSGAIPSVTGVSAST